MSLFGGVSSGPTRRAAQKSNKQLKKGNKKTIGQLKEGLAAASPLYEKAAAQYAPYQETGAGLNKQYAAELSGDPSQSNFHTQFGYDFLRDQGDQAALRNNAALGGVASGNTLTDLSKFNIGLADQSYQQYLDNLFRGSGQGLQAAGGAANAFTGQGAMTADNFNQRANATASNYAARANNASQLGANLTNINAANQANQTAMLGAGLQGLTSLFGGASGGGTGSSLFKSILGAI